MTNVTTNSKLSFETPTQLLFGGGDPISLSYASGDDFVLRIDEQFSIVDEDLGPLGALSVDGKIELTLGLVFEASLGSLPTFNTSADIRVNAAYDKVLIGSDPDDAVRRGDDIFAKFDFSDFEVLGLTSRSTGLGTADTLNAGSDDEQVIPRGVKLDLIAGATLGLRDIYYRFPLAPFGEEIDDFDLFNVPEQATTLFKIDENNQRVNFRLGDFFELDLRLPTGANTKGESQGSTLVSNKGFSDVTFAELVGDLDLMLTRLLGNIPGVGAVAKALEKSLFFKDELDLADFVPFLDDNLLTFELSFVDVNGKAGLKVTEEVTVDYGETNGIEGVTLGLNSDDFQEEFNAFLGLGSDFDPGAGQTPQVTVTLVSDSGTPDDLADDRVVQGSLGDDEILVPLPDLLGEESRDFVRIIGVDAFFDIDEALVTHSVGLGGSFQVDVTVLKLAVRGDLGETLGISFGPAVEETIPEGGVNFSLLDFFEQKFLLEGGTFDIPDDGKLSNPGAGPSRLDQLGYRPGAFGPAPASERYEFIFSEIEPEGFDPDSPDAFAVLKAFGEAVQERIDLANTVMAPFLPDGAQEVILTGSNLLVEQDRGQRLEDPNYTNENRLERQFGIWPASDAGNVARVQLRVLGEEDRNFVIAAPTFEGQTFDEGLRFRLDILTDPDGGVDPRRFVEFGADATNSELGDYFAERLSFAVRAETQLQNVDEYRYSIGTQQLRSTVDERPNDGDAANVRAAPDFQPLAINVVGTDKDDVVVYTGSTSLRQFPRTEAPVYLDGNGVSDPRVGERDLFVGDFRTAHPDQHIIWDIRAQQLREQVGGTTTVANPFGDVSGAFEDVGKTAPATIEVGAFDSGPNLFFFRADGTRDHATNVRDMERFVLRLGDGPDTLRTGIDDEDYIEMGGGDDALGISVDFFNGRDRWSLDGGNDTAILFRTEIGRLVNAPFDSLFSGVLSGGQGIDELLVTKDPDIGEPIVGQTALRITQPGEDSFPTGFTPDDLDPVEFGLLFFQDALNFATDLSEVLGAGDPDRATRDVWSGITQTDITSTPTIDVFLAGPRSNFVRVGSDVEEISVVGNDRGADVVFYAGGDVYAGGTSDESTQPVDVFVARFTDWEEVKSGTRTLPGGTTEVVRPGVVLIGAPTAQSPDVNATDGVFAGANVTDFERFIVEGSNQADILFGGAEDDVLMGAGGNDRIDGGEGADTIAGGSGNDVMSVTPELGGSNIVFGDTLNSLALVDILNPARAGLDDDLLIIRGNEAFETSDLDLGIRITAVLDGEDAERITLDADASFDDAQRVLDESRSGLRDAQNPTIYSYGDAEAEVRAIGVERVHLEGTDRNDDMLLHDGGVFYSGGEREGDADLFVADFSNQSIGISLVIEDDVIEGDTNAVRLENGVFVEGLDRLITIHGTGDDTIVGGRLDDRIDGGAGDDGLTGGAGADELFGGSGDDTVYWEADDGADLADGGDDFDRLIVSNTREDGRAFAQAGLEQSIVVSSGNAVEGNLSFSLETLTAETTSNEIRGTFGDSLLVTAVDFFGDDGGSRIAFGADQSIRYGAFEGVDIAGSDEFDDILLYQGGLVYSGGERAGDADVFAADFSRGRSTLFTDGLGQEFGGLILDTRDAAPGEESVVDIGNGVNVGGIERLVVRLNEGDDQVFGGALDDIIETEGGRDVVAASLGNDTIDLGTGDDRVEYIGGTQRISGGADLDRISIGAQESGYSILEIAAGSSSITIDATSDVPLSDRRDDLSTVVNAGAAAAASAVFTMIHDFGSVTYDGFEAVTASGDDARDVLIGSSAEGVLSSDGGDDILISGAGDDLMIGGLGTDRYVLGRDFGRDIIVGETQGRTEIHIIGRKLADATLFSDQTQSDLILIFEENAQLTIRDYFAVSTVPQNYVFFTDDEQDGRTLTAGELPSSVTEPSGLPARGNRVFGTEADEIFDLNSDGADVFFGFGGNDAFLGSPGADIFDGSSGRDFVSYEDSDDGVIIALDNRFLQRRRSDDPGDDEGDVFVSIEDVIGSTQGDFLIGSSDDNYISARGGNDVLRGLGGRDLLIGGADSDRLDGGEGNDSLFGGEGGDFFAGGPIGLDPRALFIGRARDEDEELLEEALAQFGLEFGAGDDFLSGDGGDDVFDDRFGDNTIVGGAGDDDAFAGAGADRYVYDDATDAAGAVIEGSGGRDLFHAHDLGFRSPDDNTDLRDSVDTGGDTIDLSEFTAAVAIDLDDPDADVPNADVGTVKGTVKRAAGAYADTVTVGADGNVTLVDFAGVENAVGSDLSDVIDGSDAANLLEGGAGDDLLSGGRGSDTIDGGLGEDTVDYGAEGLSAGIEVTLVSSGLEEVQDDLEPGTAVIAEGETDRLIDIEAVIGTTFADVIVGGDGNEIIAGNGGDDTLDGGAGTDTLDLSRVPEGADFVQFFTGLETPDDPDALAPFEESQLFFDDARAPLSIQTRNFENLILGIYDSFVILAGDVNREVDLGGGENFLSTGLGADTITGGIGSDTVQSGGGDDVYVYGGGRGDFDGEDGFDTLDLSQLVDAEVRMSSDGSGIAFLRGTSDVLVSFRNVERVTGSIGGDLFVGDPDDARNEQVEGGAGNDTLVGGNGADLLLGGADDDFLRGESGDDTLDGGAGTDTIDGGTGNDVLLVSDDAIGTGVNAFDGGEDDDTVDLSGLSGPATIDDGTVSALDADGAEVDLVTFENVEEVIGTSGDDRLDENEATDGSRIVARFDGGAGDDIAADPLIFSNETGLLIDDFFFLGGVGFDIIDYRINDARFLGDGVRVDLRDGTLGSEGLDPGTDVARFSQVEGVIGTDGDDRFFGSDGDNLFTGGEGEDRIEGRLGFDVVDYSREDGERAIVAQLEARPETGLGSALDTFGQTDVLVSIEGVIGTAQADLINGSTLANLLDGGDGDDTLAGLDGDDTIVDGGGSDSVLAGDGNDTIVHVADALPDDFVPADPSFFLASFDQYDGGAGDADVLDLSGAVGGLVATINFTGTSFLLTDPGLDINPNEEPDENGLTRVDFLQGLATFTGIEQIIGSDFGDFLNGNDEDNNISGGRGDDTVSGGVGLDTLDGGTGFDILAITGGTQREDGTRGGAFVDLTAGVLIDGDGNVETATNFEGVEGGSSDDTVLGSAGQDTMNGGRGADLLIGGDGVDLLDLSRSDFANGQIGDTSGEFDPRRGEGAIVFLDARLAEGRLPDGVEPPESGGLVRDTFDGLDRVLEFENVRGSRFNDVIVGDGNRNVLEGRAGNDTLEGGGGRDILLGGAGADVFRLAPGGGEVIVGDFDVTEDAIDLTAFELSDIERAIDLRPRDPELLEEGAILRLRDGTTIVIADLDPGDLPDLRLILPDGAPAELFAGEEGGTLEGSVRAERLFGRAAPDLILGGAGNDEFVGSGGNDTLDGGEGRDVVFYTATTAPVLADLGQGLVLAEEGTDTLVSIEGIVTGGADDRVRGSGDADSIDLGDGADAVETGSGADTVTTGAGADTVSGALSDLDGDLVTDFGEGDSIVIEGARLNSQDVLLTAGSAVFDIDGDGDGVIDANFRLNGDFTNALFGVSRTESGDTVLTNIGVDRANVLLTGSRDTFTTLTRESLIDAAAGDDTVTATGEGATLIGGRGDDSLTGGDGGQVLFGGRGSDTLEGGAGDDTYVFTASDAAPGRATRDLLIGLGDGQDTVVLDGFGFESARDVPLRFLGDGLEVLLSPDLSIELTEITLANISLDFGAADLLSLASLSQTALTTNAGAAAGDLFLDIRETGDSLFGGDGNDTIGGGGGGDFIDGGARTDLLTYRTAGEGIAVSLATGLGSAGDADGDRVVNFENVEGSDFDDVIEGDALANVLDGQDGNDDLFGGRGADILDGGAGRDFLLGESGADVINGGDGADILAGQAGNDVLNGGAGRDFFVLLAGGPQGLDVIEDFDEDDALLFDDRLFAGLGDSSTNLRPFGFSEIITVIRSGQLAYDRASGTVSIDGTAVADLTDGLRLGLDDVLLF
ncbi:hypothetical protein [Jannaschia seohaensis]|uniref:Ca2+-binding RTX toxin-like protein n=1 Tax=Jannaschia seohaensis TaxID=475081 RepID=A0A2Y9BBB5_9RHOB|nr:hypothetical protein [Jannaschia seohaensis]PWJ10685.1 Ca2+-binding RTX toxin-like protein [Jannaschia seohaensis]SSA51549.1 Ca2+-binding protein, RTX toxin-related [Jannaschia seohaensis]